jgi:hypothetical protein
LCNPDVNAPRATAAANVIKVTWIPDSLRTDNNARNQNHNARPNAARLATVPNCTKTPRTKASLISARRRGDGYDSK